jgi:hypothetical protein
MSALAALPADLGLHILDAQPRVLDTDVGERLGMARPTNIGGVIEASRA